MSNRLSYIKNLKTLIKKFEILKNYANISQLASTSGRGVTVAYMLWEHAVRVQIPAPRQVKRLWPFFTCRRRESNLNYFRTGFERLFLIDSWRWKST